MPKVTRRKDKNFFAKLDIIATSFTEVQRVRWNFASVGLALLIESDEPNDVVQYSFDGETVHGDLTPLLASEGIVFDNRLENNIWFRRVNPGGPVLVRVEAWRHEA